MARAYVNNWQRRHFRESSVYNTKMAESNENWVDKTCLFVIALIVCSCPFSVRLTAFIVC